MAVPANQASVRTAGLLITTEAEDAMHALIFIIAIAIAIGLLPIAATCAYGQDPTETRFRAGMEALAMNFLALPEYSDASGRLAPKGVRGHELYFMALN